MFPKIRVCLIVLILTACAVAPAIPEPTAAASATPTAKVTETPTQTSTPTLEPTTTSEPQIESDLNPIYEESVSGEFMGVQISSKLITDGSLLKGTPVINKIQFNKNFINYKGQHYEEAYLEAVARTIFNVWWLKGEVQHKQAPTQGDFENFMTDWAKAQKSGGSEDWEKVQMKVITTTDGRPKSEMVWFMYSGQIPEDVKATAVNEMDIAWVSAPEAKYMNIVQKDWEMGSGVSLYGDTLAVKIGAAYGTPLPPNNAYDFANFFTGIQDALIKNNICAEIDTQISKLLVNGKGINAVGIVTFEP